MDKLLMVFSVFRLMGYVTEPLLDSQQIHALVGEPARFNRLPPLDGRLTVVSWNIAQGARYEDVRNALGDLSADIYLLQEVDTGVRRSDYRNVARDLAHDLGMNWVFAGEFQEIGQSRRGVPALTGQAVLSRYPIHDGFVLPFENQANLRWRLDPFQPRRGGRMALRTESGGILLYNAHIESAKDNTFRYKQVNEMLSNYLESDRVDHPVVFAGDFNTVKVSEKSPIIQSLLREGFVDALGRDVSERRTSIHHEYPLDWIFVKSFVAQLGRVIDVPRASDHFPLEAAVSLDAGGFAQ